MGIWDRLSRTLDELSEGLLPDDVRDGVEGARVLIERDQPAAAAAALEEVLRRKSDHATAQYLLGVARLRTGEAKKAVQAFAAAIAQRAAFAEAYVGLGEARLLERDHVAAVQAFRDALARGGDGELLAAAYRGLGKAYLLAGDRERAARELRKALLEAPDDIEAVTALAETLLGGDEDALGAARGALEKASQAEGAPAAALVALARLELAAGRVAKAEEVLARASAKGDAAPAAVRAAALAAQAEVAARRRDLGAAHQRLLEALAAAPSAELHRRLAEVHRAAGSASAAIAACEAAEQLGDAGALAAALGIALDARDGEVEPAKLAALAARRLSAAPGDALAQAARGVALAAAAGEAGERAAARAVLEKALAAGEDRHAVLALGRLALAAGDAAEAVARARAVLARRPDEPRARALWLEARKAEVIGGGPAVAGELHVAARQLVETLRRVPALAPVAAEAARTVEAYDRPLLVTVMGEFSTGKSTFVNALVGAEVAPVGITPTTATTNILKYGRERRGRIVYRDDREREVAWDDLGATLRGLGAAEAASVRFVELLVPLEALERVHVVDTPGLNSILPEHERTAREFIAHADAVVWLFSAAQAGKASEREALEKIRGDGKRVLGVVNKVDQLGEGDREAVLAHLGRELGGLVEAFVPVSARAALAARQAGDAAALAASAWPALEAELENRYFAQARAIKREALRGRLAALVADARGRIGAAAESLRARASGLERVAAALRADAAVFARATLVEEGGRLAERLAGAYRRAAREVLDVVRPRKLPFGDHRATQADRDFLVALLDQALGALVEPTRKRVRAELERSFADAVAAVKSGGPEHAAAADELAGAAADALDLVEARVFDRFRAFARGFLRGGAVDDFFQRTLPKLALEEDNVYHALVRNAPDLRDELVVPLGEAVAVATAAVAARVAALAAAVELTRAEHDDVLGPALEPFAALAAPSVGSAP